MKLTVGLNNLGRIHFFGIRYGQKYRTLIYVFCLKLHNQNLHPKVDLFCLQSINKLIK